MANEVPDPSQSSTHSRSPKLNPHYGIEGILESLSPHVPTPDGATPLKLFLQAQDEYFSKITAEAKDALFPKGSFKSSEDLIEDLQATNALQHSNHSRLLRGSLENIKRFADRLQPYFEIIGIIIQSHPEIAAIIWGCIRATLLLACNHTSFFEHLANTISVLTSHLPQLENVYQLLLHYGKEPSERLKFALQQVYLDLFFFFERIKSIFIQKKGSPRWTIAVIAKLSVTSFESRFKDLQGRMRYQTSIISSEVQLILLENSMAQLAIQKETYELEQQKPNGKSEVLLSDKAVVRQEFQEQEMHCRTTLHKYVREAETALLRLRELAEEYIGPLKDRRHTKVNEGKNKEERLWYIRSWLDAPEFSVAFDQHCHARQRNTSQWFLEEPVFNAWMSSLLQASPLKDLSHENTLFVSGIPLLLLLHRFITDIGNSKGHPGNGKSVLAAAAVEYLLGLPDSSCYYFFFSDNDSASKRACAYRALLAQVVHKRSADTSFMESIEVTMFKKSIGTKASVADMMDLLNICARTEPQCYVVLDGIDECCDRDELLSDLREIFGKSEVKLLLFGRPSVVGLAETLPSHRQFQLGRRTEPDIQLYATLKLQELMQSKLIPANEDLNLMVDRMVVGSDGMFLWARLMIEYLKLPVLQPRKRVKILLNLSTPERLDDMYDRIMSHISRLNTTEQHLAAWIFAFLAYARTEISAEELRESSRLVYTDTEEEANDEDHFESSVIVSCACLVTKDTSRKPALFRFMHTSVRDFLARAKTNVPREIAFSAAESHARIARVCIQYLHTVMLSYPLSTGREDNQKSSLTNRYPLSEYVSVHWIHHLQMALKLPCSPDRLDPLHNQKLTELATTVLAFLSAPTQISIWLEAVYLFGHATHAGASPKRQIELCISPQIKSLAVCANTAQRSFEKTPELSPKDVWDQLPQLAEFWFELNREWGEQLIQYPSCIWTECPAFNPNPWLHPTNEMKVHSLTTDKDDPLLSPNLSTTSLKTVSKTSSDGVHIAVLGIWPSRAYQEIAMQTGQRLSWDENLINVLKQLSSGWVARYQIFSIANDPELLFEMDCPLEQPKVWTQIRQSLWKEGDSNAAENFRLQCPVAICSSLRRFAVLGDVYSPQASPGSGSSYQLASIVPSFNEVLRHNWSYMSPDSTQNTFHACYEAATLDSWVHRNCRLYLYWVWFSLDGKYLFYVDKAPSQPSSLAIWDLGQDDSSPTLQLINSGSLTLYRGMKEVYCDAGTFHPTQNLLLFSLVGSVYLWPFDHDVSKIIQIHHSFDSFQSVTFSDDGEFIVINPVTARYPVIKKIPEDILTLLQAGRAIEGSLTQETKITRIKSSGELSKTFGVNVYLSAAVQETQVTVHKDGSSSGVSANPSSSNAIEVHAWKEHAGGEFKRSDVHFEFSKLPSGFDIQNMSTTLLPQLRQGRIRMVIEGSRRPWSGISKNRGSRPLLVERHRQSTKYFQRQIDWSRTVEQSFVPVIAMEDHKDL
ncbi:hypothetical protein PSPO01_04007 [Paraphaeosphaeria sporulosa]